VSELRDHYAHAVARPDRDLLERNLRRLELRLRGLPEGPDLAGAERASKLIGALDVPNVWRPASKPGVASTKSAMPALASDRSWPNLSVVLRSAPNEVG